MTKFVERLKEYMDEYGLTVSSLAREIGFNRVTVSGVLNEAHAPSTEIFLALIKYFNCSADYLLGLIDFPKEIKFQTIKPLGDILRKNLKESKKSETQLQEDLHLSSSLTYRWLNNLATPQVFNYIRLAKYFDCSVDYLLGREV